MKAYFTTQGGDVNLEPDGKHCKLRTASLTTAEEKAIRKTLKQYKAIKTDEPIANSLFMVKASFEKVAKTLWKDLKGKKPTLLAIKFQDGRIEERTEIESALKEEKVEAAAVVDKPTRGCPFEPVLVRDIKATGILREFLSDLQRKSFNKLGAVLCVGGTTGARYRVTHRHWRGGQSARHLVQDLDTQEAFCTEATLLPASEEMLSILLMLNFHEVEFRGMAL